MSFSFVNVSQVILSLMAAIIAGSGILAGKAWKLDNSAKLFTLTFLLVTFGSSDVDSASGAPPPPLLLLHQLFRTSC